MKPRLKGKAKVEQNKNKNFSDNLRKQKFSVLDRINKSTDIVIN